MVKSYYKAFLFALHALFFCIIHSKINFSDLEKLLHQRQPHQFNGIVFVADGSTSLMFKSCEGYTDIKSHQPLKFNSQFLVGSITKQITWVRIVHMLKKLNRYTIHQIVAFVLRQVSQLILSH